MENSSRDDEVKVEGIQVQENNENSAGGGKTKQLEDAARLMFYGGCCLLPWVWGLSIIYFWKIYKSDTCPPGVKKYIKLSIQGLVIVLTLFAAWIAVFQTNKGERWAQIFLINPKNDGW